MNATANANAGIGADSTTIILAVVLSVVLGGGLIAILVFTYFNYTKDTPLQKQVHESFRVWNTRRDGDIAMISVYKNNAAVVGLEDETVNDPVNPSYRPSSARETSAANVPTNPVFRSTGARPTTAASMVGRPGGVVGEGD